jgi:hypothetical protein
MVKELACIVGRKNNLEIGIINKQVTNAKSTNLTISFMNSSCQFFLNLGIIDTT